MNVDFVIIFGNTCITNLHDSDSNLKQYSHEEADTGIVLHVIDVSRRDPFTEIVVSCSDTDVFLILLHYFEEISTSVVFRSIHHDINLRFLFEKLGPSLCKALLGFHAITGCDQTGKFFGISKLSCWKTFLVSPPSIIAGLSKLGNGYEKPTDNDLNELEVFVLNLYRKKLPPNVRSLSSLRWLNSQNNKQNLESYHQLEKCSDKKYFDRITLPFNGSCRTCQHKIYQILTNMVGVGMMNHQLMFQ